ncbi:MAG: hypothetical protein P4N24_04095 [Acidobacteriota bacterium]|nr:hypothetical protein [Acidobacteriota bacterium]
MTTQPACSKTKWNGREAYTIHNDLVQMVTLPGGGHIAEFQFLPSTGLPVLSPLWVPPWKSIEPYQYRAEKHAATYGPSNEGKLLSGIAGHNICLDYFGPPSEEEAAQGLSTHGEAPSAKWQKTKLRATANEASLTLAVPLPVAGLRFSRQIRLLRGESVAYFEETVVNEKKADHFFHWTQHVTLSPPFLGHDTSRIAISATRGRTFSGGYGGNELLASGRDFHWPFAPARNGESIDLSLPFAQKGLGFLVSILLNPRRQVQYIAALNQPHGLLMGYCFRRSDFPWVAIWEENMARTNAPWNGRSQTRGLEFSSTPSPVTRREAFAVSPLFGTPTFTTVPAKGKVTAKYLSFLAHVPEDFGGVRDIQVVKNEILIQGSGRRSSLHLPAAGLGDNGWAK